MRYACPACGQDHGFLEVLTHCVVTRRVDAELDHVETEDWDMTEETKSEYICPGCGLQVPRDGLRVVQGVQDGVKGVVGNS